MPSKTKSPRGTSYVKPVKVQAGRSVSDLLYDMAKTGFQGKSLAVAAEVLQRMIQDKGTTILLGYAGSLSTTGQYEILCWMLEQGYIDVFVGTGANLSEDLVDAMGHPYVQGTHRPDDAKLFEQGFNRYYDVYGREDHYLAMTQLIAKYMLTLESGRPYSTREFLHGFGLWLANRGIRCIVSVAAQNNVPVYCPAIVDSPYGDAALIATSKGFNLVLDGVRDYVQFMRMSEQVADTGVIYIGGGVPKDYIQLFAVTAGLLYEDMQVPNRGKSLSRPATPESYYPHKYALQITTDSPQWGGLSGCTFEEAVSWGKEKPKDEGGDFVQCYCDATIALPILSQTLAERLKGKRKRRLFDEYKQQIPVKQRRSRSR